MKDGSFKICLLKTEMDCFGEEMWCGMMYCREGVVQLSLGKKNRRKSLGPKAEQRVLT